MIIFTIALAVFITLLSIALLLDITAKPKRQEPWIERRRRL